MKRKWKIICISVSIALLVFSILLFIEIFINRNLTNNIHFREYSHYENRADFISYIDVLITAVFSVVSTITGILVYKLSSKIDQQNKIVTNNNRYKNICMTYDYLMEVIEHIERKIFNKKENYYILDYNEKFMEAVYFLNDDIFEKEDIECLRNLNISLKNYINNINKNIYAHR